jgi:hypothetical protein
MPKPPKKSVRVQYRRVDTSKALESGALPLSEQIRRSLAHSIDGRTVAEDVLLRIREDEFEGTTVFNGQRVTDTGSVFGELVHYEPGASIPLIRRAHGDLSNAPVAELDLRQDKVTDDHELVRGALYFKCRENHVCIIEHGLSAERLQRFLNWFLLERTGVAPPDYRLFLLPSLEAKGGLDDVEKIIVRPEPVGPLHHSLHRSDEQHSSGGSRLWRLLKSVFSDTTDLEALALERDASIELTLEIKLTSQRGIVRLDSNDTQRLLRDIPLQDLKLISKTGRQEGSRITSRSFPSKVQYDGAFLSRLDAWAKLNEADDYFRSA